MLESKVTTHAANWASTAQREPAPDEIALEILERLDHTDAEVLGYILAKAIHIARQRMEARCMEAQAQKEQAEVKKQEFERGILHFSDVKK